MTTAPAGTPQPHRRRRRDLAGTPAQILAMLLHANHARLDIDLAAIAAQTSRQTIIQAIHRLRSQGLVIHTKPEPPGPLPVSYYQLDDYSRERAWELLKWWTDPDPSAWRRYAHLSKSPPPPRPDPQPQPPPPAAAAAEPNGRLSLDDAWRHAHNDAHDDEYAW